MNFRKTPLQADDRCATLVPGKNDLPRRVPPFLKVKQAAVELLQKDGHLKVAKRVFVGGYGNPCRFWLKVAIPWIFVGSLPNSYYLLMEGNPAAL